MKHWLKNVILRDILFNQCSDSLEPGPELAPVLLIKVVPFEKGGAEEVGGVAVEEGLGTGGIFGLELLPGLVNEGKFACALVEEVLLCGLQRGTSLAPTNRGNAIGLTEVGESCVVAIAVLATDAEHHRQLGRACENGEARAHARIVEADPCHATDGIGKPRAELNDGAIGAP